MIPRPATPGSALEDAASRERQHPVLDVLYAAPNVWHLVGSRCSRPFRRTIDEGLTGDDLPNLWLTSSMYSRRPGDGIIDTFTNVKRGLFTDNWYGYARWVPEPNPLDLDRFIIAVKRDNLDGGWIADVRELDGCVSHGDTAPAAVVNVAEAWQGVIDARVDSIEQETSA